MAQEVLGNVEMWLPSELLGNDLYMEEKYRRRARPLDPLPPFAGSLCFPYDYDSNLNSPLESSEESDEEDRLSNGVVAGLTQQMARSFLHDEPLQRTSRSLPPAHHAFELPSLACSPPSPLCTGGMWSEVPSPSTHLEPQLDSAWDILYDAAGQVKRRNLSDDVEQLKRAGGCGLLAPPSKLSPPCKGEPSATGYYYDGARHQHHALLFHQIQQLKQQQFLKHQQLSAACNRQNRIRACMDIGNPSGVRYPPLLSRSTWPPLPAQQPPPRPIIPSTGPGMRAVFLGTNGVRKQSTGTGVFLPRRAVCPTESRKKPACSTTVLVPEKVIQALNLNLEDMGAHPRFSNGSFFVEQDTCSRRNSAVTIPQSRTPPPPVKPVCQEMRLPPEWTY